MLQERGLELFTPLLPRAARPDTRVVIEVALPEAAALDRRAQPAHSIGDRQDQPAAECVDPQTTAPTKSVTQTPS